ncbi:MAG: hypothetical protein CBC73_02925 [Flavobacteriales bacterium TMED113]|nr:MAG: hypothetical protein CBC73_02925 [Flavobacteriales bacterium TMED113]
MKITGVIITFISIFFTLIIGCSNEDDIIGKDLIDSDLYDVNSISFPNENYNILSFSIKEDSISARGNYNLLGVTNDPYFGKSEASFYMQILLPSNNIEINPLEGTNYSLELSLPYHDSYGDTLHNIEASVYEINENIGSSDTISEVFSTQDFDFNPNQIANKTFNSNEISDSIQWGNETVSPRLIIDLSEGNLINNLINADMSSNETFVETFKGLYINSNNTENTGCITYFNTSSPNCFLRLSYTDINQELQVIDFPVGSSSNRLNNFKHDYSNSFVNDFLETGSPLDSIIYLQSMGGICAEINLNFLENFSDSGYVVSNAILNLPVYQDNTNNLFYPPGYLVLTDFNNEDVAIEGVVGGIYNSSDDKYTFVLTDHIQKIISQNHNSILRLYVGGKNSNAERLLIDNREGSSLSLDLVIIK